MIETNDARAATCPACDHPSMSVFFEIEAAPVLCNVLWSTRAEALEAARAPIRLGYCEACEFVYNLAFDPSVVEYSVGYENSLHCSPHFQHYAFELVDELIERYGLRNKDIVEIGCGQGEFLNLLCRRGRNRGVGFDPSFHEQPGVELAVDVSIKRAHFTENQARRSADLICCRHVLEHIARPLEMLSEVRRSVDDNVNALVFFEVPNGLWTLEELGIWDIIYEHCSYFVPVSLRRLFERAGFEVLNARARYGGQFITIEARPSIGRPHHHKVAECGTTISNAVDSFAGVYERMVSAWQSRLRSLAARGERVAVWGAGSKGVSFLNVMQVSYDEVPIVVDLNPQKHLKYVAGTGQKVIAPDTLMDHRPTSIIVMNPLYRDEIRRTLGELGIEAQLLDAHPCDSTRRQTSGGREKPSTSSTAHEA